MRPDFRGTMMWDTGEIPDSAFASGVSPATQGAFTVDRPLLPQLAAIGYTPADITFLALSHYHGDHVANANAFAGSTWIVQQGDRAQGYWKGGTFLLRRWNLPLELVNDDWKGVAAFHFLTQTPAEARTVGVPTCGFHRGD